MSMLDGARDKVLADPTLKPGEGQRVALEKEGIKTSLSNLRTFPCIQNLEGRGKISLHGAYFDIGTGTLQVLNSSANQFVAA